MRLRIKAYLRLLGSYHILCMNRRNARYIAPGNPRQHYRLVDEKIKTKTLAADAHVPCPETYGVVTYYGEITRMLTRVTTTYNTFVIKPNRGAAGRGVMVLERDQDGTWHKSSGVRIRTMDLHFHVTSILSGLYSLSELPDQTLIEQRIFPHVFFKDIACGGTPDVRIILFRTVPVMAMMRLPTTRSDGRANLHQGAVGLGVAIATGISRAAVCHNDHITHHPDTGANLLGLQVPDWPAALAAARRLAAHIPLNYIGVDLMLDAQHGPMMIEANARPGLNIQVANNTGLRPRLEFLQALFARGATADQAWAELYPRIAADAL
jgi:alpha-L-glutamate ligase-like protein